MRATIVHFVVIVAVKLRSKVSRCVKALRGINQKERHIDLASSSSFSNQTTVSCVKCSRNQLLERTRISSTAQIGSCVCLAMYFLSAMRKATTSSLLTTSSNIDSMGILERFLIKYHSKSRVRLVPYAAVVFREGTLVNMGDGGDINWDWQGNFIRSGNNVLVFKPCVPGIAYEHGP